MFGKKSELGPDGFDTIIGVNTTFDGNIVSAGTVRVDGKLNGDLKVDGDVFIGSSAVVKGNITGSNVHLSGTVEGNIHSNGVLRILSTARLYGDIKVHSFVADEGGIFQGKCNMVEAPGELPAGKPSQRKSHSGRDYKKSSVLSQIYDEKEKNEDNKE